MADIIASCGSAYESDTRAGDGGLRVRSISRLLREADVGLFIDS